VAGRDIRDPHSFGPEEVPWFKALGVVITALREERCLTQAALAQRAGFTPEWLGQVEAGEVATRWGELRHTARALGTNLPDLIRAAEAREASP
jgi:transcriptional regulator with XRE-family HTH domain